jgi:hypothetical protein
MYICIWQTNAEYSDALLLLALSLFFSKSGFPIPGLSKRCFKNGRGRLSYEMDAEFFALHNLS